jgi:hypothetical protein
MLVATLISVPSLAARCVHRDYGDWCCCCSLCVVQHPAAADAVSITQDASSGDAELPAVLMLTCCCWLTTEEEALDYCRLSNATID